ncbi:hypothetical protein SAMN05518863_10157 [Candidatus Pantoea symbiotica]|jgi:hypothetical protein|uniref:Bacterial Ig-like domain-containing protein n=1 Tax=Candidatus Pantoea symbiotica TaxID=1884370 RepID=A0A1I3Q9F8_9GAMM|nr:MULTISPECIES: Ig-like domain-containing protein [Pantoea]KAJ9433174.1 Ig-like domain-containing protein [Pantoea sp. YR343]MRT26785.1 hypothetical protein [Enterobacteriaceae bacterium RIT697]SFJ30310.1 hypothetical protein SAMN05518863_10157 [Pantoea symbiotica]SFU30301.1 hypothetical protein SAMN05518864_10157 [Pantoea sp. YR525]
MVDVNLAVVSGQRIIQAESLSASSNPVTIKAVKGARYVLAEGDKLVGPQNITVKRSGKNLWLMLEGHDQPQLIIENYYDHPGELIGRGEAGDWHNYSSANADRAEDPAALQDGEMSPVLLSQENAAQLENLSVDSNALAMGLIAVGVLGTAAALVFITGDNHKDDKHDAAPPEAIEELPTDDTANGKALIDNITDDVGAEQGAIAPEATSDDSQPTLSGSGLQPDSSVEISDNGSVIGTAVVDAAGNWQFTPEAPLTDGQHEFVVVVTDPQGAVSAPSDPAVVIIDTSSVPAAEALSMEDLLPADSDLMSWAQLSLPEELNAESLVSPVNDHTSNTLDDLSSTGHFPV